MTPSEVEKILKQRILEGQFENNSRFYSDRDIEKEFGLSRTTASKIIANLVAEKLLYRRPRSGTYVIDPGPNVKSKITCLAFYDSVYGMAHPYMARVLQGLHNIFDREGHLLQLCQVDNPRISLSDNHILHSLLDTKLVDGIFITIGIVPEELKVLKDRGFKLVLMGPHPQQFGMPLIDFDIDGGYREGIEYCQKIGKTKIGALVVEPPSKNFIYESKVVSSLRKRIIRMRLKFKEQWFLRCDEYMFENARSIMDNFIEENDDLPNVIFAGDDNLAMGAIEAIKSRVCSFVNISASLRARI